MRRPKARLTPEAPEAPPRHGPQGRPRSTRVDTLAAGPACTGAGGDALTRWIGIRLLEISHGTTSCGTRTRERLRLAGADRSRMGARLEPFPRSRDGASGERRMPGISGQRAVSRAWLGACLSPPPGAWEQPAPVLAGAGVCGLAASARAVGVSLVRTVQRSWGFVPIPPPMWCTA